MKTKSTLKEIANNYLTQTNGETGITLVALVITIVVLLILAGVTITDLLGDDGIIKKAQDVADLMNNAIQSEQNEMNTLLNELDEINNEDALLEVVERKEDNITVKINKNNLKDYQFSIDGTNYTELQSSNEYTFIGLPKAIVDETNYKTAKGTEYTIYAKAKDSEDNEIICNPIKTTTIVEVQGDASQFLYKDLGEEIYITGLNSNYTGTIPLIETEAKEFISKTNIIIIPSYINGKPITKISKNLFTQNLIIGVKSNEMLLSAFFHESTTEEEGIIYVNNETCAVAENGNMILNDSVYLPKIGYLNFYGTIANMYGEASTSITSTNEINFNLKINNSEILLPPTLKEICTEKVSEEVEMPEISSSNIKIENLSNPLPPDTCNIYILDRNNLNNVINGAELEGLLNNENVTITYIN